MPHCALDVRSEKQVQTTGMVSDVVQELGGLEVARTTFPGTF